MAYQTFMEQQKEVSLFFVNDGSNDNTADALRKMVASYSSQAHVLDLPQNVGKAEAVRYGFLYTQSHFEHKQLAYLDADLSTTLEEAFLLSQQINANTSFVFGSRISKDDNFIARKWYRYLIGRTIATVISKMLGMAVYDTQCGCKIFDSSVVPTAFADAFTSRWLFDVEIFYRLKNHLGKTEFLQKSKEIPLQQWIDKGDSRVKMSYMFRLWIDLYMIFNRYHKK